MPSRQHFEMTGENSARHALDAARPTEPSPATPSLVIVDARWSVVVACATDLWEAAGVSVRVGRIAPIALQKIVNSAVASLNVDRSAAFCARVYAWAGVAITIFAVEGESGPLIALAAQPYRARRNLRHAQRTYGLSPRELEILRHVLRGSGTSKIAAALNIADSTVVAHVKSLLTKTKAANRAALVARVLGWEET